MRRLSDRLAAWYVTLLLGTLVIVTACGGDEPAPPPEPTSTPELAVVVFETEEPTATPTEVKVTPTPSPAATVGMGASLPNAEDSLNVADFSSPDNRASDENPLTGLKVDDPTIVRRRPLMVRVGNDPGARPQVGLEKADIVYEEMVEWWVTRFTAVYLSQDPKIIAPIRSARLINLYLTPQYQGVLVNSGGSDPVRWELSQSDVVNLDEFFIPQPFFYRENEGWQTRLAVDATAVRNYLEDEALDSNVKLRGFTFSKQIDLKDFPQEAVGEAEEMVIPYPPSTSEAMWQYDPTLGKYLRFTTGEPMMTFDGDQITASNVIVYFAEHLPTDIVEDSNGATSIRILMNGLGTAWLLRDGKILKGNWETDGRQTPRFFFNEGQPMPLKPGNTWVQVIPPEYDLEIDGVTHTRLGDEDSVNGEDSSDAVEVEAEVEPTSAPSPTFTPIGAQPTPTPKATATAENSDQ
jgi:hypothetical protein